MGSTISSPQGFDDGDLSIKGQKDSVDPILEKLRNLHVWFEQVTPILKSQTADASLTEILLRRSSSQASEALDPTTTVKLFQLYQEWQRSTAARVGKNQEELGYKIIGVEELSMKLLQRLNYASRVMEASATNFQEVHSLQIEISEMKRKLTKTLQDYEQLSQKVDALGLQNRIIKPLAIVNPLHQGKDDIDVKITSPSAAANVSGVDA
ncbi:unnamed protein product [Calypogeia fissa]